MLNDCYGGDAERMVLDYDGFLASYARRVCADLARVEDVAQEGRVALWQAVTAASPYPVEVAKSRMKQVAWYPHRNPPTGSVHEGNRYEPSTISVQAEAERHLGGEDVVASLFGLVDSLEEVEIAYHHGEIAQAIAGLTAKQRAYVYARFWCGMEGTSEAAVLLRQANPHLADRNGSVWGGRANRHGNRTPGVRDRLAEALGHLRELVTT